MQNHRRFTDRPSVNYLKAVALLRELEAKENTASQAYAEAVWETHERDFAARYNIERKQKLHVCFDRLRGKRCKGRMCESPRGLPAADHVSEWVRDGETCAILSQPYGVSFTSLKEISVFCDEQGLEARIDTWPSYHFPCNVLTIIYERKGGSLERPK